MKISVIVPVYNVEEYISKCLLSIKDQSLVDFECIIVDDGTKDNSIEIAKEIVKDDGRFNIVHKENGGLSDARNYGLRTATGEYVCFVDSDDYIRQDFMELAYRKAKEFDSDITVVDMVYVYSNGRESVSVGSYKECETFMSDSGLILINNSANNKIFKKSFLDGKEFIKGIWYEDLASIPVWISKANNVSYVSEPLYFYLQRDGSISHSANPKIFDIYKALDIVKNELNCNTKSLATLYYDNIIVMTTLRIRDIEDRKLRFEYYGRNMDMLNEVYPEWFKDFNYLFNFKQRIVYGLMKARLFAVLNLFF